MEISATTPVMKPIKTVFHLKQQVVMTAIHVLETTSAQVTGIVFMRKILVNSDRPALLTHRLLKVTHAVKKELMEKTAEYV